MEIVSLTGEGGQLRAGYLVAATLGPWSLTVGEDEVVGVSSRATIIDHYRMGHGGSFDLRLDVGRHGKQWRFRAELLDVGDGAGEVAIALRARSLSAREAVPEEEK